MQGYMHGYVAIGTHAYTYIYLHAETLNDFLTYQIFEFFIVVLNFGGNSSQTTKLSPSSSSIKGAISFFLVERNFLDL